MSFSPPFAAIAPRWTRSSRTSRTAEEVESWAKKDPIPRFATQLREMGLLDDAKDAEITNRANSEVDEATERAENAPDPAPEEALNHVLVEGNGA